MTKTPLEIIENLKAALGQMLTSIEDRVDVELTAQEQRRFDEAAELYAQMKDAPAIYDRQRATLPMVWTEWHGRRVEESGMAGHQSTNRLPRANHETLV